MSLPRLALVTPLPPSPSGIADYSLDVALALTGRFECDFFTDQAQVDEGRLPAGARWFPTTELPARHAAGAYAGLGYQLGNSPEHAVVYELLPRLPGLLVLHDLVLHHARARAFLDSPAARAYAARPDSAAHREAALADVARYRDELAYSYPAQAERLLAAQLDTSGALLPYAFPLVRLPAEAARLVAVHNDFAARAVREEAPGAEVLTLPMPARPLPVAAGAAAALRARLGLSAEHVVVGCFGLLTPEKRVETIARAVARAAPSLPSLRLLLVGGAPDRAWLQALLERVGVASRTVVTGRVPFDELGAHLEAADLAVHLRYPTARETSAALLRLLAQGRPVVMADLEHQAAIPEEAALRADVADEEGEVTRALLRLGERPDLRARLGRAAAAWAAREHSFARAAEAWAEALARCAALPVPRPRPSWPAHWRASASGSLV